MAAFRPRKAQDIAGLIVYAAGAAIALFSPAAALFLFVLVALPYFVPGLVADRAKRLRARPRDGKARLSL